jgi:hypothetical protein
VRSRATSGRSNALAVKHIQQRANSAGHLSIGVICNDLDGGWRRLTPRVVAVATPNKSDKTRPVSVNGQDRTTAETICGAGNSLGAPHAVRALAGARSRAVSLRRGSHVPRSICAKCHGGAHPTALIPACHQPKIVRRHETNSRPPGPEVEALEPVDPKVDAHDGYECLSSRARGIETRSSCRQTGPSVGSGRCSCSPGSVISALVQARLDPRCDREARGVGCRASRPAHRRRWDLGRDTRVRARRTGGSFFASE